MSLEFPFKYATIDGLGTLFYPVVRLEIKTVVGWREFEFLVDTGADVTTFPTHLLPVLGLKKSDLAKSTSLGVGGYSISTWECHILIKIGKSAFSIMASAVESKNDSLPLLLGRKHVFEEKFNLLLDSKKKLTILSENR